MNLKKWIKNVIKQYSTVPLTFIHLLLFWALYAIQSLQQPNEVVKDY